MDSSTLTLDCWVYGTDPEKIFSVEIPRQLTVAQLKEAIKLKKPVRFRDADPDDLALYKTSFPDEEATLLNLSQFPSSPESREPSETLLPLIVVDAPAPHMTVNCWVRGQDLSTVFSVEIAPTKTVSILKRAIKDENLTRLRDIDANGLALYKVSILEKDLEETVKGLAFDHGEPLLATATLSEVFPDAPRGGHVHIIVEAPLSSQSPRRPRVLVASLIMPS
ncbi:hypothetical protein F5I97DRAFT_1815674 [Phlebopus sp. FC_14]|nr:hypothetical protein F5I97DRAFT_1815674 [Phlebopus sp. FC_14]